MGIVVPLLLLVSGAAGAVPIIAAPGLAVVDVDPAKATFLHEYLVQAMASEDLRVVTEKEIATLLGVERQKQLLGCGDSASSCMAELGAALGAEYVLLGQIAHLGTRYKYTLKVISAQDAAPLVSRSGTAANEEELADLLAQAGKEMGDALRARFKGAASPSAVTAPGVQASGVRRFWWIPVAGGVAIGGTGAAFMAISGITARPLSQPGHLGLQQAQGYRDDANTQLTVGTALVITGAAALVAGAGLGLFGGSSTGASAFLVPGGAGIGIAGELP